jgi:hypothetical protein
VTMTTDATKKILDALTEDPDALMRAIDILKRARKTETTIIDAQIVAGDDPKQLREALVKAQGEIEGLKREWATVLGDLRTTEFRLRNFIDVLRPYAVKAANAPGTSLVCEPTP